MTDKLWLIRTSKKQILGPVSRDKVIELIEKGALTEKDEVARGNGYWFQVREKELLDKYLFGDIPQEFNPISEAPDILTAPGHKEGTGTLDKIPGLEAKSEPAPTPALNADGEEIHIPSGEDLEYPDMGVEMSAASPAEDEIKMPEEDDLDYPDMGDVSRPDITVVAPTPSVGASPQKSEDETMVLTVDGEEVHIPSGDDLEYPDMGGEPATDDTLVMDLQAEEGPEATEAILTPQEDDLDYPEIETPPAAVAPAPQAEVVSLERKNTPNSAVARALGEKKPALKVAPAPAYDELAEEVELDADPGELDEDESEWEGETDPGIDEEDDDEDEYDDDEDEDEDEAPAPRRGREGSGARVKREVRIKRTYEAPARNDRYLFVLLAMVLVLLASGILYYYSKILGKPLPFLSEVFFSNAYAQTTVGQPQQIETTNLSKKKTL